VQYEDFCQDVDSEFSQAKLRWGEEEIRTYKEYPDPFPLYPGEEMPTKKIEGYEIINANQQIKLRCLREFFDKIKNKKESLEMSGCSVVHAIMFLMLKLKL